MITNTSKFTGVQPVDIPTTDKPAVKTVSLRGWVTGIFAGLMAFAVNVLPAAAAYTPAYTPVAFGTPTANAPDMIAIVFDCLQGALNLAVSNWLTMLMIFVAIVLIAWGAVTGLFRRGKRRGR